LVDCRRDHIDCRLNNHYPLDAIFLSCQRPTLGEQLVASALASLVIIAVGIKAGGWRALNPFR